MKLLTNVSLPISGPLKLVSQLMSTTYNKCLPILAPHFGAPEAKQLETVDREPAAEEVKLCQHEPTNKSHTDI